MQALRSHAGRQADKHDAGKQALKHHAGTQSPHRQAGSQASCGQAGNQASCRQAGRGQACTWRHCRGKLLLCVVQGCVITCGRLMRRCGSLQSMREIRSLREWDTLGVWGKVMGWVRMTLYRPMMLGSLNGTVPAHFATLIKIMQMRTDANSPLK